MALYRTEGVPLRSYRLGEADRIVVFLSPEHGKVRAVAKGVRKTKSRIGARVEPLSSVALLCWRGRELDVVSQVELLESFKHIRADLERMAPAMAMLEIVDQVATERQAAPELHGLLLGALRRLDAAFSPLLFGAFCLKLLALEGVGPVTDRCARCGAGGPLVAFDAGEGGFLCASCRRGQAVSEDVVALTAAVLSGGLGRLLAGPPPDGTVAFEHLATSAVEHHLERRLRAMRNLPAPA